MDNRTRCSKSFSCDSLFTERHSLKRKYASVFEKAPSNLSFKNDDYNYLINNNELIMTCREALLENERSIEYDPKEVNIITSSTACHSAGVKAASSKSVENITIKDFSKWLDRTDKHLKSVCYCSFADFTANSSSSSLGKEWIDAIAEHKAIQAEIQNIGRRFINSLKANCNATSRSLLSGEETRWHSLWLKSFECLMILEEHHTCPSHQHWNRDRLSGPLGGSKRYKSGHKLSATQEKENIGTMKNRRVQTTMMGTTASATLGDVSNSKYEIIQKDIGYSSDADMSDACELNKNLSSINSSKSPRRRVRRRKQPRPGERPWSFHAEWTGWDYYNPLGLNGYQSTVDLNSFDNENLLRDLTEFGENYETWFKPDEGSTPSPSEYSDRQSSADTYADIASIKSREDEENSQNKTGIETSCRCDSNSSRLTQELCSSQCATINDSSVLSISAGTSVSLSDKGTVTTTNINQSSNTRLFIIYLAITIFLALLLSTLVAHLSPISPHVQKTYLQRPPPN
ncbi:uncharacterized protein LOC141849018 [Brevipalpus obovatus]|uniref:uncharacterized protein LOC141849018 n=1 Tax=Brevipalpus obovatus TaxID=246614 RepID=UPI003D9F2660